MSKRQINIKFSIANLNYSFEICDSDKILCPRCFKYCGYAMLKTSCLHSNLSYLFDNIATSFLGAVIAVWGKQNQKRTRNWHDAFVRF